MPVVTEIPASDSSTHAHQSLSLPNELLLLAESQWLFTEAELLRTPSVLDGLSPEKESENRGKGVNFILQVGIMLKLPQITLATASVFLHRFFMRHSMVDLPNRPGFHYYSMAATSLFLATKVEENCRKMKELVVACVRVAQKDPKKAVDDQDKEYWRWKDNILHNEDLLLEAICFDLSLEPPYKTLFELLVFFGEENNKRLRNAAWAFVNDSCLTMLCLLFPSRTIAASALYAAAKHCDVSFPDDEYRRPWWDVAGVELRSIRKACNFMAGVYENTPLRGGRDGGVYERTPNEGDEANAKTRRKTEGVMIGDDSGESGGWSASDPEKRNSKRERQDDIEDEHMPIANGVNGNHSNGDVEPTTVNESNGNLAAGDTQPKRQKLEVDGGQPNGDISHSEVVGDTVAIADPPVDDVSEEGEVES
ncbi:hypothetical protein MMC07_002100 [Pseudocyphellaria aurata]|nr:hypothetical protein [Pseudocyphellaria aurata]